MIEVYKFTLSLRIFFQIFIVGLLIFLPLCLIYKKAGFDVWWVLVLLIPVVNIAMIWIFAFSRWPNLQADIDQDL